MFGGGGGGGDGSFGGGGSDREMGKREDPGVGVNIRERESFERVDGEEPLDEMDGEWGDAVPHGRFERDHPCGDLLVHGDLAFFEERRRAREHNVEDDAHGPHVYTGSVPRVG